MLLYNSFNVQTLLFHSCTIIYDSFHGFPQWHTEYLKPEDPGAGIRVPGVVGTQDGGGMPAGDLEQVKKQYERLHSIQQELREQGVCVCVCVCVFLCMYVCVCIWYRCV
jgi:hypothetical protein